MAALRRRITGALGARFQYNLEIPKIGRSKRLGVPKIGRSKRLGVPKIGRGGVPKIGTPKHCSKSQKLLRNGLNKPFLEAFESTFMMSSMIYDYYDTYDIFDNS